MLGELRPALAEVLEHLSPPVRRASDLRRRLGLSHKVSWGLFNAATGRDMRALPSLMPGERAMEGFLGAAARHGVPPAAVERARAAFRRFEEMVDRDAGSRDAFETMVSGLSVASDTEGAASSAELRHKRAAFRAAALLWGRQARASCLVKIMHPSAGPEGRGLLDRVLIRGLVGLRSTRRGVPAHTVASHWSVPNAGDPEAGPPEPLDAGSGPEGIGLLPDFCSRPLPEFRLVESRPGHCAYELAGERLGPSGEVTYFAANIFRADSAAPGSAPGAEVGLSRAVTLPTEAYVGDILMHRSTWDTSPPAVRVYACRLDGVMEDRPGDLLRLSEGAEYLGEGPDAARTPLIPRYADLLTRAITRAGWRPAEFRVFRCLVRYPVMYTRIRMVLGGGPAGAGA